MPPQLPRSQELTPCIKLWGVISSEYLHPMKTCLLLSSLSTHASRPRVLSGSLIVIFFSDKIINEPEDNEIGFYNLLLKYSVLGALMINDPVLTTLNVLHQYSMTSKSKYTHSLLPGLSITYFVGRNISTIIYSYEKAYVKIRQKQKTNKLTPLQKFLRI